MHLTSRILSTFLQQQGRYALLQSAHHVRNPRGGGVASLSVVRASINSAPQCCIAVWGKGAVRKRRTTGSRRS